jgi:hypothetical protein
MKHNNAQRYFKIFLKKSLGRVCTFGSHNYRRRRARRRSRKGLPNANADPERLANLKKRDIPGKYIDIVKNMLQGRVTSFKFDKYREQIPLVNEIGRGDPLYGNVSILQ